MTAKVGYFRYSGESNNYGHLSRQKRQSGKLWWWVIIGLIGLWCRPAAYGVRQPWISASSPFALPACLDYTILLNVIKAEADTYGLDKKYYVTTDRTIRNWLKATHKAPPGFSAEVMSSLDSMAEFAHKYIESVVAAGSSELAANAKKEVAFNPQFHGITLETSEDAELMMEALKDASKRLSGGNKPETKRKRRPF